MTTPLAGARILDFTRYQQGPFATVMLADMGAEVIKIEEPGGGDFGRRMWKEPDGFSAFFESLDRGKKSVCIDLRKPEGERLALLLGERVDVVVENFRPGTMEGWASDTTSSRPGNPASSTPRRLVGAHRARLRSSPRLTRLRRRTVATPSTRAEGQATSRKCPTLGSRTSRAA